MQTNLKKCCLCGSEKQIFITYDRQAICGDCHNNVLKKLAPCRDNAIMYDGTHKIKDNIKEGYVHWFQYRSKSIIDICVYIELSKKPGHEPPKEPMPVQIALF